MTNKGILNFLRDSSAGCFQPRGPTIASTATPLQPIQIGNETGFRQCARSSKYSGMFGLIIPKFFETYWLCLLPNHKTIIA